MPKLELKIEITNGLLILRPEIEIKNVIAAFTTRVELDPRGPKFCNFGFSGKPGARASRKKLCESLGVPPSRLTAGEQTHTANVAIITAENAGNGGLDPALRIPDTDALATSLPGTPLVVMTADCVPVLLIDPVRGAAAAVHAGWRGSAKGIIAAAVSAMRDNFRSAPKNLIALVGPHIGPCCYTVGKEVARQVSEPRAVRPEAGAFLLDLGLWNETLLARAGLLKKNIHRSALCTSCRTDIFYSYRADKKNSGSNASIVALVE